MTGPSDKAIEAAAVATASLNREGVGNPGPDFFSTPYARAALVAAYPIICADVVSEVVAVLRENNERFDRFRTPCGCEWDGETLHDCPACIIESEFESGGA